MQTNVTAPISATINSQTEVQKILSKTDLDWEVRKEDLVARPSDLETPCAGLFRNDTNYYLGVVSKRYTIYQNKELVDTIMEAAKHFDLEIASGGWLYDGERVYLQLELPSVYVGKSEVKRYITAMNSHNGKGSVVFGATNDILNITPRGVESKKFFQVFREMDKFRHTQSVHSRVNNAIQGLFSSITKENETTILMQKMAKLKVKDELLREIMFNCYKIDLNKSILDLPTRTQNRIKEISRNLDGEINKQDGSLWGLFQGVLKNTEYTTPKKISSDENVYAGSGRAVNMKAFNIIKNFIEKTQ
jgi:hypothetical protein